MKALGGEFGLFEHVVKSIPEASLKHGCYGSRLRLIVHQRFFIKNTDDFARKRPR